jgi:hypothetical protein
MQLAYARLTPRKQLAYSRLTPRRFLWGPVHQRGVVEITLP